jgi:methylaspartate ammonia-lyase
MQGVKQVMLDIEGPTWNFTQSENREYVSALRSAVEQAGLNVTVYCTNWPETFGPDFTAFQDVPLIYAVRAPFSCLQIFDARMRIVLKPLSAANFCLHVYAAL